MFSQIIGAANEVHDQLTTVYWALLPLVLVVTILVQLLAKKTEQLDPSDTLRRLVISVVLLLSINYVTNGIATLSDLVTTKITADNNVWDFLKNLGPSDTGSDSSATWFDLKEHALYVISLLCYLVAYLGFFVSEALVTFVWTLLYAMAPLMILAFLSKKTEGITKNLYMGFVTVSIWRILFASLGALLLNVKIDQSAAGLDEWLLTCVVNLCIGISMLLIPLFSKSLISDGLSHGAAAISSAVTYAAMGTAKSLATKGIHKSSDLAISGARRSIPPSIDVMKRQLAHRQNSNKTNINLAPRREPKSIEK